MRVVFVGAHLSKGGGQAIQVIQLFRALRRRLDGVLLCLEAGGVHRFFHDASDVHVVGPLRFPDGVFALRRALSAEAGACDVVQVFDAYYGMPAAYLARALPRVVRLGTDPVGEMRRRYGVVGLLGVGSSMPLLLEGSRLVVNSEDLRRRFERYDPVVIPNGVDLERFAHLPSREEVRKSLHLPETSILLVFVGKIIPVKRVEWILEAVRRVPGTYAVLVGGYREEWYGDAYYRRLQSEYADIRHRCLFTGEVPWERVGLFLRAGDMFVFPSSYEGMPNAVLEAMAAGLPLVASNIPAHRVLLSGTSMARLAADAGSFAAAVEELASDEVIRNEMGRQARAFAEQNLSFERCSQMYLDLYESLQS